MWLRIETSRAFCIAQAALKVLLEGGVLEEPYLVVPCGPDADAALPPLASW